jgi:hypothetical protein
MSMPVMRGSELVAVETSTTMTSDVGS